MFEAQGTTFEKIILLGSAAVPFFVVGNLFLHYPFKCIFYFVVLSSDMTCKIFRSPHCCNLILGGLFFLLNFGILHCGHMEDQMHLISTSLMT